MSGKLDKSLDEILTTSRSNGPRRTGRVGARRSGPTAAAVAPVGGVKKNARTGRAAAKPIPTGPSGSGGGEGKIQVSGFVSYLVSRTMDLR